MILPDIKELRQIVIQNPYLSVTLMNHVHMVKYYVPYRGWVLLCSDYSGYNSRVVSVVAGQDHKKDIHHLINNCPVKNITGKAVAIARIKDCRPVLSKDRSVLLRKNLSGYLLTLQDIRYINPMNFGYSSFMDDVSELILKIKL